MKTMRPRVRELLLLLAAILPGTALADPLLLRNVSVIDIVTIGEPRQADVLVEGEKIAAIAEPGKLSIDQARVIDGKDRFLIPGLAEMHAHLPTAPDQRAQAEDLLALFVANGVNEYPQHAGCALAPRAA